MAPAPHSKPFVLRIQPFATKLANKSDSTGTRFRRDSTSPSKLRLVQLSKAFLKGHAGFVTPFDGRHALAQGLKASSQRPACVNCRACRSACRTGADSAVVGSTSEADLSEGGV